MGANTTTADEPKPQHGMPQPRKRDQTRQEAYYVASQWQLIWWKFRKHVLANVAWVVLALLYLGALFAAFISPTLPDTRFTDYKEAPPQAIRVWDGERLQRPFIYGITRSVDPNNFRRIYTVDTSQKYPIYFFVSGEPYKLFGIPMTRHLFGTEGGPLFLVGTDQLGRDLFTRIMYGSRISLSIGLVGVALTFALGLSLGGISGYMGGTVDTIIQRTIDMIVSIPTIPLWMALAAAVPRNWSQIKTYMAIVIITSFISWAGLARVVRGKLLSVREEDFTMAARLSGMKTMGIIVRHMLPAMFSYIIVSATLSIPGTILGETALSFLGLGLQPPVVSWGVLLQDAQSFQSIAYQPWLLAPALWIIVTVLMFNFLGDGLRDAADPYR